MSAKREPVQTPWWSDVVMYWFEGQISITFYTDISSTRGTEAVIDSLHLDNLKLYLHARGYELKPFAPNYTARSLQGSASQVKSSANGSTDSSGYPEGDLNNPVGKYLFHSAASQGTTVVSYFMVEPTTQWDGMAEAMQMSVKNSGSTTRGVVDLINHNLEALRQEVKVPIQAATANWFVGGTRCFSHGGPACPPAPVPAGDICAAEPGNWRIALPELSSSSIGKKTGQGVTVFVLDAMPEIPDNAPAVENIITSAAKKAGAKNTLLNKIASEMNRSESPCIKFRYTNLPDSLVLYQVTTGRDIQGQKMAYHMEDHGLFVTGIIRDLAPEADIEYVRVLNDFGMGDCCTLITALEWIHGRMSEINPATGEKGDLHGKPVVINMSLVVAPADEELVRYWFTDESSNGNNYGINNGSSYTEQNSLLLKATDMQLLRSSLHGIIQELAACGAVMVGAAGNDSFAPYIPMRIGPRYPAAFPEVISVGAVDREGNIAHYSNYAQVSPQHNGIATYGGSILTSEALQADNVDAMIGVYSADSYPAIEAKNPALPDYEAPNTNAWAYWSGTSFATPIISAVAARVLEQLQPGHLPARHLAAEVQWAITTSAGQKEVLGTVLGMQPDFGVSLLKAEQCHPTKQQSAAPSQEAAGATM